MSETPFLPPALSTVQTEETFEFQSYQKVNHDRTYLGKDFNKENMVELITKYYCLPELINYFQKNKEYRKITLQFPDELIVDSAIVVELLQNNLERDDDELHSHTEKSESSCSKGGECCQNPTCKGTIDPVNTTRKIWALADTSYSSCCVDEVATEHVKGDIVVHFGDACLNSIQKLPVIYSFGKPQMDVGKVIAQFENKFNDKQSKVCLMANAPYTSFVKEIYAALKKDGYTNLVYAGINCNMLNDKAHIIGYELNVEQPLMELSNRQIFGDTELTSDGAELQSDFTLFHITIPEDPHLLYLTTQFQSITLYDPADNSLHEGPFPSMMKRYRFMHMARTAGTIGILVNTLSLRNTKETINKLSRLIRENGKKHYLFVVGKPNVAKLANFEPIDIWCILGCGQGGIVLDQHNEFYKPIVTPYELLLALSPELTWTGSWITDFKKILDEIQLDEDEDQLDGTDLAHIADEVARADESEAPEFNAVTGQYVSTSRPLRNIARLEIETPLQEITASDSKELVSRFSGSVSIRNTVSTSAAHLQNRLWTGLGSDYHEYDEGYQSDGATVEEGISGVARGYQFDRSNASSH